MQSIPLAEHFSVGGLIFCSFAFLDPFGYQGNNQHFEAFLKRKRNIFAKQTVKKIVISA